MSSHYSRDDRPIDVAYRHVRPQVHSMSSKEAVHKLGMVVHDALQICHHLQTSFARETELLGYAKEDVMDFIWHDKLEHADRNGVDHGIDPRLIISGNYDGVRSSSQRQVVLVNQSRGVITTLKQLHTALNTAVDATVYETTHSAGDSLSFVEKLHRMAEDIDKSCERIFKRRKDMDVFVTDLEMLHVLLKRHGGNGESRGDSDRGEGVGVAPRRTGNYEHATVDDEQDERSEAGFASNNDRGFHKDNGPGASGGGESENASNGKSESGGLWSPNKGLFFFRLWVPIADFISRVEAAEEKANGGTK